MLSDIVIAQVTVSPVLLSFCHLAWLVMGDDQIHRLDNVMAESQSCYLDFPTDYSVLLGSSQNHIEHLKSPTCRQDANTAAL